MKDRYARVARLAKQPHDLGDRLDILDHSHIDAGHHDLARRGVAQVEHLVDDALLLIEQRVLLVDHVLDLLFGDVLAVIRALDAHKRGEAIRRCLRKPHERASDLLEHGERLGHALRHTLRVGKRNAFGHELTNDDGQVGDDQGNDHRGEARRDRRERRDAKTREPLGKRVGQIGRRDGRRGEADKRDGDLDGSEEVAGVRRKLGGVGGAAIAFFRLVVEHGALCRGERHLRHGEIAVDDGEHERGDDADGDVHRDGFKPPGTKRQNAMCHLGSDPK